MFYVEQMGGTYDSIDSFMHDMIQAAPEPEYALSFLEDLLLELFPEVPFDSYRFSYDYWSEYEGPHRIGVDYNLDYDLTALRQAYPEHFI
jgi:hypothetical protein